MYDLCSSLSLYRLTLNWILKDFPESAETSARCLADYDKIAISHLTDYPAGSVVICATLQISIREFYNPDDAGVSPVLLWHHSDLVKVRWRIIATVFDLALDPIISTNHPLHYLLSIWPYTTFGLGICSTDFEACFFRDASRSHHYTIDDHQHNAVATLCLFFLIHRIFPLFPPFSARNFRLKIHPWRMRRRNRIPGRGIPHMMLKLPKFSGLRETPSQSVQLLLSLRFALLYLPPLLHCATYSEELVELAKCWRGRGYMHHIFPDESAETGKAVKYYLHRVGGVNGYIIFLDLSFHSRY